MRARNVFLAASFTVVASAGAASGGERPDASERPQFEAEFWAAIGAEWPMYCRPEAALYRAFRDRLVARGKDAEPFLETMALRGPNWQAKTMAAILLERLRKKLEVDALLASRPTAEYHRAFSVRAPRYIKELTAKAAKAPMVLVEAVWKGNEFRWEDEAHTRGYAAVALGRLGEQRAVQPLILLANTAHAPSTEPPWDVKAACEALGRLGDPRAVPVVLRTFAAYGSGVSSCWALERCMDRRSLPLVNRAALSIHDETKKTILIRLIEKKEREFGIPGPQAPPVQR